MKRLKSEVKAASEKQQTNTHHRENEGERWRRTAETDRERHLAKNNLISPQKHTRPAHLKPHQKLPSDIRMGFLWPCEK